MRTCPYCLYRFPDDAPGCPRCGNTLPAALPRSQGPASTAAALTAKPALPSLNWKPLAIGGAAILVVLILAIIILPRLIGGRQPATANQPMSDAALAAAQATANASRATPLPPAGWREWLTADYHLKLYLPETYLVVNFADRDWQDTYSTTLTQDSYLRSEASQVQSGAAPDLLLVGVSPRSDAIPVRVMLLNAPTLAGNGRPTTTDVQAIIGKLGIEGDVTNTRNQNTCGAALMTQMEILPTRLDNPNASHGYIWAATEPNRGYLMIMLVSLRAFPSIRSTLEKAMSSLCTLPPSAHPPTATPSSTFTPLPPTPTPTAQPSLTVSPAPAGSPTPTASFTPTATPKPGIATPTVSPTLTPAALSQWMDWQVQDNIKLSMPRTYRVVNFTESDWQEVFSATWPLDSYLKGEVNKVKAGTSKTTLLVASSPTTGTVSVRVMLVSAAQLAGAEPPTLDDVQAIINKLGIRGNLSKASGAGTCGAQLTRMELVPPASSPWGGSVLAATDATKGYLLITLISPQQATDRAEMEKVLGSLCILPVSGHR